MRNERRSVSVGGWAGYGVRLVLCLGLLFLLACRARSSDSNRGGDGAGSSPAPTPDPNAVQLLFTYGSEKQDWIEAVTSRFNDEGHKTVSGKVIHVEAVAQGSGEAIDDLLSGTRKAHLTSPASAAFIKLGNAKSRARTGGDLVGETRSLVLSPVVIALWRPMAEAIGWGQKPIGWGDILALAQDPKGWASHGHPEWGAFKLGHTHPEYSNSGLISILAESYAGSGKVAGLTLEDIRKPETARYVAGIESAIVHYGSSTGFFGKRMFAGGPQYLSAAVLYENMVIESYGPENQLPFPVVAVYPKEGTFWSDHPVGIVQREWVTPEHREAANLYIDYLLARPQQEQAMRFGFRPSDVEIPLGAPFDAAHGVDPKEPQTTLEVPAVEVIDAALQLWRQNKKHTDLALVFDMSGSMEKEQKIENAKDGAQQLIDLLDPEDTFSFLPFNNEPSWSTEGVEVGKAREEVKQRIGGLFASGGTALYDAIAVAYERQERVIRGERGKIAAIVVLSDGADTDSTMKLDQLLQRLGGSGETAGVRVFTIGYGASAERGVLEKIADATQAKYYAGDPTNIRSVFRDISTFF
jgi:Ca-activated chloride channel family protein